MKEDSNVMTKMSVRIQQEEKDALIEYANDNDLTMSQVIRRAIKEFLANNK